MRATGSGVRLFVAVFPPAAVLDDLQATVAGLHVGRAAGLGVNARVATRERLHVTVAFLGDVADVQVSKVDAALAKALAGTAPVTLQVAGGGRFGRGKFTVLWAGLRGDVSALDRLGRAVRRGLKRARLPYDDRPFRPHLTLARPADRVDRAEVAEDIAALAGYAGPSWTADSVHLVRSHLGPHPSYEVLSTYPLPG